MIHNEMPKFLLGSNAIQSAIEFDYYITHSHMFRHECITKGMYAFVSWKWVLPLVEWIGNRKCLEVMAGTGYLSYALREKGVNIIATDDQTWYQYFTNKEITPIEALTANRAIWKYGKDIDVLIISWPPDDDKAYQALRLINYVNPNAYVIYIGEFDISCADDNFFAHFNEIKDDQLFNKVVANFERFMLIKDRPALGKYKQLQNNTNES